MGRRIRERRDKAEGEIGRRKGREAQKKKMVKHIANYCE